MEVLGEKREAFSKALETLNLSLSVSKKFNPEDDYEMYRIYRDSTIKRFEYCSDLFWKYLKTYLEEQHGVIAALPKSTYREALAVEIISPEEAALAIDMSNACNNTAHIYREEIAEQIMYQIPRFFKLMDMLLQRL